MRAGGQRGDAQREAVGRGNLDGGGSRRGEEEAKRFCLGGLAALTCLLHTVSAFSFFRCRRGLLLRVFFLFSLFLYDGCGLER
jgi:hypothetical protein